MADSDRRQVVLIGAGHAHLYVAAHAAAFARHGVGLVLVEPDVFWYSGLATGMLGGMYGPALDQIDPQPLIERHGGRFVRDRAVGIEPENRIVRLASGARLPYAACSLNLGSEIILDDIPGATEHAWTVKPISNLWRLRVRLEAHFRVAGGAPLRVVVVGGGATGCEVAANIDALARRHQAPLSLTLLSASERLLAGQPLGASRSLMRVLQCRGVQLVLSCRLRRVEPQIAVAEDERRIPFDVLVLATGLRSCRPIDGLEAPAVVNGGFRVDDTLRALGHAHVFGSGDCVSLADHTLPKLGVFGVRQAPVLLHNLLAVLTGGRLRAFRPQRRCLIILNLGCTEGLAVWGPLHWRGRCSLWLKDRIDRRFLAHYRAPRGDSPRQTGAAPMVPPS